MRLATTLKRGLAVAAAVGLVGIGAIVASAPAQAYVQGDRVLARMILTTTGTSTSGHGFANPTGYPVLWANSQVALDAMATNPTLPLYEFPAPGTSGPIIYNGQCIQVAAAADYITLQNCTGALNQTWSVGHDLGGGRYSIRNAAYAPYGILGVNMVTGGMATSFNSQLVAPYLQDVVANVVITSPTSGASVGTTNVVVTGTAQPNSPVTITVGGVTVGTTTSNAAGNWSATVAGPLTPGSVTLTATAAAKSASVTVNAVAPIANVVITSPTSGASVGTTNVVVTGTAQPNSPVNITVGGVTVGTTTSNAAGNWSATVAGPLTPGSVTLTATAAAKSASVTVNAVAPIANVVITSPTSGASVGTTNVVVTGTAQPNSPVNITVGGVTVGTTTSNAAGNWSATVAGPLTPGSVTLTATAAAKSASVTVNAVAPVMADVVITAPTSGAAISTKSVPVSGTAQPNSTVNITVGGATVGTTTSNASGAWSAVVAGPLTPGDVTFTATAAGKSASVTAKAYDFAITAPVESADVATVGTLKVEVSGISKPNAVVVLTDADGTALGTTTADANGKWTTFVKLVPEGRHTIVATSGDDTDSVKVVSSTAFDGPVINPNIALGALVAAGAVGMGFTIKRRRQLTDAV